MCRENPLWGAPRIHGELLKLGIDISQGAVSKYMIRHPQPPSQTWRSFLRNHLGHLASVDFFVVPTATFRLLFVFIVLHHERRRIVYFRITTNPTSTWAAQQIREAFPWDTAPRYLIRDRDGSYGVTFRSRLRAMWIDEIPCKAQKPDLVSEKRRRFDFCAVPPINSIRRRKARHSGQCLSGYPRFLSLVFGNHSQDQVFAPYRRRS
jgi:hypothetical protein